MCETVEPEFRLFMVAFSGVHTHTREKSSDFWLLVSVRLYSIHSSQYSRCKQTHTYRRDCRKKLTLIYVFLKLFNGNYRHVIAEVRLAAAAAATGRMRQCDISYMKYGERISIAVIDIFVYALSVPLYCVHKHINIHIYVYKYITNTHIIYIYTNPLEHGFYCSMKLQLLGCFMLSVRWRFTKIVARDGDGIAYTVNGATTFLQIR